MPDRSPSAAKERDPDVVVVKFGANPLCGCRVTCGDVPEADDKPNAVCKGLPHGR